MAEKKKSRESPRTGRETIALHCRQAIISWMCKDARAVMFAQNHNDLRLCQTRLCASIWISTRVSAKFAVFMPPFQRSFRVEESLKAVCASRQGFATEPVWEETKFDGQLGAQSVPHVTLPKKFRRAMDFGRKTLVHGAIERGLLQHVAVRMIGRKRNVNL
jgi:hypothetical protein